MILISLGEKNIASHPIPQSDFCRIVLKALPLYSWFNGIMIWVPVSRSRLLFKKPTEGEPCDWRTL